MKKMIFVLIAGMAIFTSCDKNDDKKEPAAPVVITATGDITSKMNEFRVLLGEPLNTTTGKTSGRREINWDVVPEEFITQNLPKTFFNPTDAAAPVARQRGFTYESDGEFRVSTNGFGNIELTLATQIQAFSGDRVFANISETLWDTQFQVAGSTEAATVNGFGAVFLDVDIANNSFLEFFSGNKSLGKFFAPVHDANTPFSFVGVWFKDTEVTKVRVGHGNGKLVSAGKDISNGGVNDIVALDDFLYSEPKASK